MNWLKHILFLRRHIKKSDRVIQVGFSLDRLYSDVFPISWFAKELIIIEPDPRSYFKLQKRKWLMRDNYIYYNDIISNGEWGYISLAPRSKHNSRRTGSFMLKCDVWKLNHYPYPDVIIITCNGSEYDVLESAIEHLRRGTKFIIANIAENIEMHLKKFGYKLTFEKVGKQKLLIAEK